MITRTLKYSILTLVVVLIAARLALPYFLINYVEKQINKIPEYRAQIYDIDVHLWRGSYTIKKLRLWKGKKVSTPYLDAPIIDLSVEWSAIFHGKLVAKILASHPVMHFIASDNKGEEQLSIDNQWVDIVKSLFPLNINELVIENGDIYFQNPHGNPPYKTYMKHIDFSIENMQERNDKITLPSQFHFTGDPMGGGNLHADGKYNPFAKRPTFYVQAELKSLDIAYLADLLKHYTAIDVTHGTFNLYGEAAAADGRIKGYAKPFIKNLKIGDPKKESPLGVVYNGLASVAAKVLENSDKKTIATEVKLQGNIDDPNASVWSIIGYLFHHAFIQALLPQLDNDIKVQDVIYGKPIRLQKNK